MEYRGTDPQPCDSLALVWLGVDTVEEDKIIRRCLVVILQMLEHLIHLAQR